MSECHSNEKYRIGNTNAFETDELYSEIGSMLYDRSTDGNKRSNANIERRSM